MYAWSFAPPASNCRASRSGRSSRIGVILVAIASATLALTAAAAAGKTRGAVIEKGSERDVIDWTRGLIMAVGAASGDLRTPSPTVARQAARRRATEAARARLLAQAQKLRVGDATVGELMRRDSTAQARMEAALQRSLELGADYGSDGSAIITAALPLEAVRIAVHGTPKPLPRSPAATAESPAATAVIIDARKVLARPRLGPELITESGRYSGPTVFYRTMKAALRDPRLGEQQLRVTAIGLGGGRADRAKPGAGSAEKSGMELLLEANAEVDVALQTGALVVIVLGKKS